MFYYQDANSHLLSKPGESQRKIPRKVRRVRYLNDSPNSRIEEPIESFGTEIVEEQVVSLNNNDGPVLVPGLKTVDNRNPNRVVDRSFARKTKKD
jgi:hypothetical protein